MKYLASLKRVSERWSRRSFLYNCYETRTKINAVNNNDIRIYRSLTIELLLWRNCWLDKQVFWPFRSLIGFMWVPTEISYVRTCWKLMSWFKQRVFLALKNQFSCKKILLPSLEDIVQYFQNVPQYSLFFAKIRENK